MPCIFEWSCTHYKNATRKWISGKLRLRVNNITFIDDTNTDDNVKLIFAFDNLNEIKKATSSFVYSAIVFLKKNENFWFSSFSNRDHVFNTINHFWKHGLIGECEPLSHNLYHLQENELLRIVHGTQDTLMGAAKTLEEQGKQLNRAAQTMNYIHNDITVAERVADDLDSYFSAWRMKKPPVIPKTVVERDDASFLSGNRIEYEIIFAKFIQESHKSGYLILRNDTIDILNEKSISVFISPVNQLSKIHVHSPWDLSITKRAIGNPDFSLHLVSTKMPAVIQNLKSLYRAELSYDDPPDESNDDSDDEDSFMEKVDSSNKEIMRSELFSSSKIKSEIPTQRSKQIGREANNELSKVLTNIKNIALNISDEQDAQLNQIDLLNESVDRAQSRIKSTDWKVQKMT